MTPLALLREALASAWGRPIVAALTTLMVAGMCVAVLMTQGRAVGTQQAILGSLDDAGTRALIIRASQSAGLDLSMLERLDGVSSIESASAYGPATDAVNSAVPGGARVAHRDAYGLDVPGVPDLDGIAVASAAARERLGFRDMLGSVTMTDGREAAVVAGFEAPDGLEFLEPLLLTPHQVDPATASQTPITTVVVVAATAADVVPLTEFVISVLDVADPTGVTIETSAELAELRGVVEGQLSGDAQTLTAAIFALAAALVAAVTTALVMMRRRDYGRRRALGASQRLIVGLVLLQSAVLAVIGSLLGAVASFVTLQTMASPQPGLPYYAAVCTLAVAISVLASVLPAAWAARREPAHELRVP